MVIYGNNLHEKLQGVAISREYLKYNTPFCDMVDAPEWQTDINLALDFNKAASGNEDAAITFVQDLTLNSATLDPSTIEFYLHKIKHNPIFAGSIKEMRARWDNLDGIGDDFQDKLKDALKDCLNSPCNLFRETSDSIGRMAQTASTRTSDNSMGSLSAISEGVSTSISNMVDGLDQTITNSIPSIFTNAWTEVVDVADKAFTNTQDVLMGKKNLLDLTSKVQEGKSFRDPAKVFRYSPDVKSYYDYSAAASNVLSKIKEDIGGCFNRFEFKYRYNPYENNMARPIGTRVMNSNGKKYDSNSTGTPDRSAQSASYGLDRQTSTGTPGSNLRSNTITLGKGITKGNVKVSKSYILDGKTETNRQNYSIFASLIDEETNTLWYEDYAATANDILTLQGQCNLNDNYRIGTSIIGVGSSFVARALTGGTLPTFITDQEIEKYSTTTMAGNYATGFKHQLDDEGMETLFNTPETQIINDGVAISNALFREFVNDPTIEVEDASYKDPQLNNTFFVAVRPIGGKGKFKYYKVIDSNSQDNINVDFTVGAWSHYMKSFGLGELQAASEGEAKREKILGTNWTKVKKIFTNPKAGQLEIRVCTGSLEEIKAAIEGETTGSDALGPKTKAPKDEAKKTKGLDSRWGPILSRARELGADFRITEGYRSPERQNELYAQGRTKPGPIVTNARGGQSKHQTGRAIDIVWQGGKGINNRNQEGTLYDPVQLEKIARIFQQAGREQGVTVKWGGDFKSIYDGPHFEIE